jgi:hypothetical protein
MVIPIKLAPTDPSGHLPQMHVIWGRTGGGLRCGRSR